jgi:uncharacterized protein YndB with AHSA1/START domain
MNIPLMRPDTVLEVNRVIRASRERVFAAWTNPAQLQQWFAVAEGFTTPVAEVDLRMGGRYRLGMKAPGDNPLLVVGGIYQEVVFPKLLVFTWRWEHDDPDEPETLVTVEFLEVNDATKVLLKHERFTGILQRDKHGEGWAGCFENLARFISR